MEITRWAKTIKDALNRFAKKIPTDVREDFEQEVYLRLLKVQDEIERIETEQGSVAAKNYVYGVSSNRIKDLVRAEQRRDGMFDSTLSDVEYGDEEAVSEEKMDNPVHGVTDRELDAAIKQLSREEQHVIRSQYFQGHTWKEMISNLDKSRGSVWSVRDSALQKLRIILEAK